MCTEKSMVLTTMFVCSCSWTLPYPKTYEVLPDLLAKAGDWVSFKLIMTDLVFLWRKLQGGNQLALLHLYDEASLAMFAKGLQSQRLDGFRDFFFEHLRHLTEHPNLLFGIASLSRNEYVKKSITDLLEKSEQFITDVHSKVQAGANATLFHNKSVGPVTACNVRRRRRFFGVGECPTFSSFFAYCIFQHPNSKGFPSLRLEILHRNRKKFHRNIFFWRVYHKSRPKLPAPGGP